MGYYDPPDIDDGPNPDPPECPNPKCRAESEEACGFGFQFPPLDSVEVEIKADCCGDWREGECWTCMHLKECHIGKYVPLVFPKSVIEDDDPEIPF